MKNKLLSWILTVVMVTSFIQGMAVTTAAAATGLFIWNKSDTMDASLTLVENKAGEDDVLLEVDVADVGDYELSYFLEDGRKTTVNFSQQVNKMQIVYKVEAFEVTTTANITQELVSKSYQQMDYTLAVPDWVYDAEKTVGASGGLEFTVLRNASSQYSGYAFEIDQKKVYFKWDFQTGTFYYQIMDVGAGNILPVTLEDPAGQVQTQQILKSLADFEARPTHFVMTTNGANIEMSPIIMPGDEAPGEKPGIELSFSQPKAWNAATWTYEADNDDGDKTVDYSNLTAIIELTDVAQETNYLDFQLPLYDGMGSGEVQIPMSDMPDDGVGGVNEGVVYIYDTESQKYRVQIVQDKSSLANQEQFLQWDKMEASKIYNTALNIQVNSGFATYGFKPYTPEGGFSYTYMAYELKRSNMSEAYLDITPYDAGSQEETEYAILYAKAIPQADENGVISLDLKDDLWVKHYYTDASGAAHILIPVPFKSESSQDVYQVVVTFSGTALKSEVLNYQAIYDNNVPPTTPMIDAIDNLYIVPSTDITESNPSTVQFDLAWTAPGNNTTKELDTIFANSDGNSANDRIYYELMVNEVPTDSTDNPYQVFRVYEVYKENGAYKVRLMTGLDGNEAGAETANYDFGYDDTGELFRMNGIAIYDEALWSSGWATTLTTVKDVESTPNGYSVTDTASSYDFEYPGVNYLRMRAVAMIDGELGVSQMSVPVSLSLSDLTYDVPIPEALAYTPVVGETTEDPVGIDLSWNAIDYDTYVTHMLTPVDLDVFDVGYRLYIAQDSQTLGDLLPETTAATAGHFDETDPEMLDAETLDALRDGELVYFDLSSNLSASGSLSQIINGMDPNENYYIRIATLLTVVDGAGVEQIRYSDASEMLSVTTPVLPEPPNEGDIRPLSVENMTATFVDDTNIIAQLDWDYPDEITFEEDRFGFEFISIQDMALPDTIKSSSYSLDELADSDELAAADFKLWRLMIEDGEVVLYSYQDGAWTRSSDVGDVITLTDQHINFIDGSNMTNRVYYYYVRTINLIGGTINAASTWQMDTLTTAQIKAPINLAVDYDYTTDYDPLHESIVHFDAPIPLNSDLENDYVLELHIKGEADSDYSTSAYETTYLGEETGPNGYTRYYYQISDLLAGKAYSLKVRIEDRTKNIETLPDGSQAYPKSSFSSILILRTEFSQEDYDKSVKYQSYLDFYDKKVKAFEQGDYIILENSTSKNLVKYRNSYALGAIKNAKGGIYSLYCEDVATNTYYLPADFVEAINDYQVTLKLTGGDQELQLRPNSLGRGLTDAIDEMVASIDEYAGIPVDYYIKMTISANATNSTINGKTPSGEVVDIKMAVVGAVETESAIERLMLAELTDVVAWQRAILERNLALELENGIDDAALLAIVQDALDEVQTNYYFAAGTVFEAQLGDDEIAIGELSKGMLLYITPQDETAMLDGVKKTGTSWVTASAIYQSDRYLIESQTLTSYALVAKGLSTTALTGYTSAEINVINQYALYDIFTTSELTSTTKNLQKHRMIPALAKMLGAKEGVDTTAFLREKGIILSGSNLYADMTRQEILYVYTQVFGKKNGIVLNSGKIVNYNIIADISQVQSAYQQTLLIGANLKMFDTQGGLISPTGTMTIHDFIKLLARMEKGLNG